MHDDSAAEMRTDLGPRRIVERAHARTAADRDGMLMEMAPAQGQCGGQSGNGHGAATGYAARPPESRSPLRPTSLHPQRLDGVDPHRLPGRHPARESGREPQEADDGQMGRRVQGGDLEKKGREAGGG